MAVLADQSFAPGATDLAARIDLLAERLSEGLRPLAAVAYNYRWSWAADGPAVFRDINPYRWALNGYNPVRFLGDLWPSTHDAVDRNPALRERIEALAAEVTADLARPARMRPGVDGPVAFFCAEFGFHVSMPIYSGGLGVLAGDLLKEASDQALPMIGVGLFYRRGYVHQRLDLAGRQQEYWVGSDPKALPMARVSSPDGRSPLTLSVRLGERDVAFEVWRVDVGKVPLLLLDADLPANDPIGRWTTARLYDGNRTVRLNQYGLLGIGGARVLAALGIEPAVVHLNEGHPALAPLELAAQRVASGVPFERALGAVRSRTVFTTHTPIAAGNETYEPQEFIDHFGELATRLGLERDAFLDLCRIAPGEGGPGLTPLAMRVSHRRNGVSRLHGEVTRALWQPMFPEAETPPEVPITHVTNAVHLATFLSPPMRELFSRFLGPGFHERSADPELWEAVREIPDEELWRARCAARADLVAYVRERSQIDRLQRGEPIEYVRAIERGLDVDALTLGFARRFAAYKRVDLLTRDARAAAILRGEERVQMLVSGKAHPSDEPAKDLLQRLYAFKRGDADIADRVVIVEDYDLDVASHLVAGCDVWINLPRPFMEASGTSGMKATFNGVLQLSVLDGWWAEAYDGDNGWAITGGVEGDTGFRDTQDAQRFYDLLEHEVIPLFYDRGDDGVPHGWCQLVKRALVSCAPRYTATRMLDEYIERIYPPG